MVVVVVAVVIVGVVVVVVAIYCIHQKNKNTKAHRIIIEIQMWKKKKWNTNYQDTPRMGDTHNTNMDI